MSYVIFSATGCARCKIVKQYMDEHGMTYQDKNIYEEGKGDYQKFYAKHRSEIYRGPDGIEFPIVVDDTTIKQGIGPVLAYLQTGNRLDGFVRIGHLHKEWVDGIDISGGDPACTEELLTLLRFLKGQNLKLEMVTNGRNASLLAEILKQALVDSLVMEVKGPEHLYEQLLRQSIQTEEVEKSIKLAAAFGNTRFETVVAPIWEQQEAAGRYLTAKEIGQIAQWIKELTGNNKIAYQIKLFKPEQATEEKAKKMEAMESAALLRYRSEARNHSVTTDIEK